MSKPTLPIINMSQCTLCGACADGCPERALVLAAQGPIFQDPARCTYCTQCEELCPTGAIQAPLTVRWSLGA